MNKTFVLLAILALIAFLPLACSYGPSPTYPSYDYYHILVTPTVNPTYAVPALPYKTSWSTFENPNALAFGMGTTVYVAEGGDFTGMVEVFNAASPSTPITQWTGYGNVSFKWPDSVAVNPVNKNIYILDGDRNAVYELTPGGVTVATWRGYSGSDFFAPEGIGADASGNIYVADTGNNMVDEFDSSGNALNQWNSGAGEGFYQPSAVSLDTSGNVYVADAGNERVLEFSPGGAVLLGSWSTIPNADLFGIAVTTGGNVFAADYGDGSHYSGNGLMEEYDSNGNLLAFWGGGAGSSPFGPDGVAVSGSDVYVADFNNNLIQVFGP